MKYFLILSLLLLTSCTLNETMQLTSSAFADNAQIPIKYSYKNENISPPLSWSNAPPDTETFAIIVDDPDAPVGDWSHWVIFNIPSNVTHLSEGIPRNYSNQGTNDFKKRGYDGPSPPSGTHRYIFHLYALDTKLNLNSSTTKQDLLEAMEDHILAEAKLIGKFSKA
jgi:Raf kinase inhibitor-like YbhB/YbcL family protein